MSPGKKLLPGLDAGSRQRLVPVASSGCAWGCRRLERNYHDSALAYQEHCKVYVKHSHEEVCGEFAKLLAAELQKTSYNAIAISPDIYDPDLHSSCTLNLFVLSDGFFKNKACLSAVVDVLNAYNSIALFYKLSMFEFKREDGRVQWRREWKSWQEGDDIARWNVAIEILGLCESIDRKDSSNITQYVQAVVEAVQRSWALLQVYWSKESMQIEGRVKMCELVDGYFSGRTTLLGLWGIWGLGKSTLGKALCDFYFPEFGGRVCYLELDSTPLPYSHGERQVRRMKQILQKLFEISEDFLKWHVTDVAQAHAYLDSCLGRAFQKVFLVVDNIQDSPQSFEEARDLFVRKIPFPRGSKVLLLARSYHTLEQLLQPLDADVTGFRVEKFPQLPSSPECDRIFSCELSKGGLIGPVADQLCEAICKSCHPLAIQSAAAVFAHTSHDVVRNRILNEGLLDKVFETLKKTYELLELKEQQFFLDVALFMPSTNIQCLRQLHDPPDELFSQTSKCIRKLRSEAFLRIKGRCLEMPAVCKYFADWVVQKDLSAKMIYIGGLLRAAVRDKLPWSTVSYRIRSSNFLQRVAFEGCIFTNAHLGAACILDLSSCKHLRVLRLWGNICIPDESAQGLDTLQVQQQSEHMNPRALTIDVQLGKCSVLESVEIVYNMCPITVKGDFSCLKCFKGDAELAAAAFINYAKMRCWSDSALQEQCLEMPENLQILEIFMPREWSAHEHLQHLEKWSNLDVLRLHSKASYDASKGAYKKTDTVKVSGKSQTIQEKYDLGRVKSILIGGGQMIDVSAWINLSELVIEDVKNVKELSGLEKLQNLRVLHVGGLNDLESLLGTEALGKLEEFHMLGCGSVCYLQLPGNKVLRHCCVYRCERLECIEVIEVRLQEEDSSSDDDEEVCADENRIWLRHNAANWWQSEFLTYEELKIPFLNLDSLHSNLVSECCFRFDDYYLSAHINVTHHKNQLRIHECPSHHPPVQGALKHTAFQVVTYSDAQGSIASLLACPRKP